MIYSFLGTMVNAGNQMIIGHYPKVAQDQEGSWLSNKLWEADMPYINVYTGC